MNLNQVTVPVLDIEKAIVFYQTLGLKLIVQALPHYARFVCEDGSTTFSLHQVPKLPSGDGIWVYFELEHMDEKIAELQQKGITFEELPVDQPWLWREARLKDLDNNQIILYYAGENRLNPPWRVAE
jgi:catechol 2,3-dioxygenase-like lactoylglutathione lyase family enzyme